MTPDASGKFKGISVPSIPWHEARHMRHVAGYITLSPQMAAQAAESERAWRRLERTAADYENASAEDRAALDAFLAAQEEDDERD